MVTRSNHDCQFLLSKHHVLASIHYIIKYISKPEASLHLRLTIAGHTCPKCEPPASDIFSASSNGCNSSRSDSSEDQNAQSLRISIAVRIMVSTPPRLSNSFPR